MIPRLSPEVPQIEVGSIPKQPQGAILPPYHGLLGFKLTLKFSIFHNPTNIYGTLGAPALKAAQVWLSPAVMVILSMKEKRKEIPITTRSRILNTDSLHFTKEKHS